MKSAYQRVFYLVAVPGVLALAFVAIYFLVLRPMEPETIGGSATKTAGEREGPDISVSRPEISHLVNGRVTWRVYADSIESDNLTGRTSLARSTGVFYRDENDPAVVFEFESPLTVYNEKSKMVEAEGRITGRLAPEMYELEAGGMRWSEDEGALTAENVILKSGGSTVKSGKLEILPREKKISLTGGVDAEILLKGRSGR